MSASAAIADPLLRRACGLRARPSDPPRTARVRIGSSRLRAQVSRRCSSISRRTVMNYAGNERANLTPGLRALSTWWERPRESARALSQALRSSLRKNHFGIAEHRWPAHLGLEKNACAGCSKRPDFSPAQPWHAKTRLVPSKAAASEGARRTLRYVEPLSAARTKLADFFSILL
jgi:hypothetical protein